MLWPMATVHSVDGFDGTHSDAVSVDFDVIVVGAGFAGLYALHRLRSAGLSVRLLEAAPEIGGTWYWNAYPGARCDVESADYSYSFDPELDQEWTWSERYAAQPEILEYINFVADRFGLRNDIQLSTSVASARYEDEASRWVVATAENESLTATYVVLATGGLSAPLSPPFPGADQFRGESYMTPTFPQSGVDFAGKRVAVIGTGSSGVQIVPAIADDVEQLFVFQRTAQFSIPGRNHPLSAEQTAEIKATYPARRARQWRSHTGLSIEVNPAPAAELSPEQRRGELDSRWQEGGALAFTVTFGDVLTDISSNEIVAAYLREKTRERLVRPELAEHVLPQGFPFGAKRPCADHGYYEALQSDSVSLVDIRENSISRITPDGVELADGTLYEVDVIVYAIGYDAVTGALTRIDVNGRGGAKLRDVWASGPVNYLGMTVARFPNMFMVSGPGSPLTMFIRLAEQQVDWIGECIRALGSDGRVEIEATEEAQESWTVQVEDLAERSVYALDKNSYYYGANVPGKAAKFPLFLGGLGRYRKICDGVAAAGYDGFRVRSV